MSLQNKSLYLSTCDGTVENLTQNTEIDFYLFYWLSGNCFNFVILSFPLWDMSDCILVPQAEYVGIFGDPERMISGTIFQFLEKFLIWHWNFHKSCVVLKIKNVCIQKVLSISWAISALWCDFGVAQLEHVLFYICCCLILS